MNYSHKHKFVWHAPFKVASRATADILRVVSDMNPHLPIEGSNMIFTHENMWPENCPRNYLHIVNVRHPYYRWVSYWKHGLVDANEIPKEYTNPLSALKWASDERCDAWSEWRVVTQFEQRIDHIIHAESVLEDLRKLPFIDDTFEYTFTRYSKRPTKIPVGTTWDEEELRELVYDRFRQDYDNLGYGKWDNYDHLWDCSPKPTLDQRPPQNFPSKL